MCLIRLKKSPGTAVIVSGSKDQFRPYGLKSTAISLIRPYNFHCPGQEQMADPEKHTRYLSDYKPNDYFWGLGIENETYLQFAEPVIFTAKELLTRHRPERYSVNYFHTYNSNYRDALSTLFPDPTHMLPLYLNSHSFQKTDLSGNHVTTYEREPKPNPKFRGETIHEFLCRTDPISFGRNYKITYVYDGDTIEFMTQRFYKTTVEATIAELLLAKVLYLRSLNAALRPTGFLDSNGPLIFPPRNAGFATYATNRANITTFNNGTFHLNFTLPTQLGSNSKPCNRRQFVDQHRTAIRCIQALEPLIIALYGTPDPLAAVAPGYSKGSQRCAVSRYIGIGTYDTAKMQTGKILTLPISEIKQSKRPFWWYNLYHSISSYAPLDKLGADINFNKHGNHGIEIRFLDSFDEARLQPLMTFLVHVLDFSLAIKSVQDPTMLLPWNTLVVRMLKNGATAALSRSEIRFYAEFFNIRPPQKATIESMYAILTAHLKTQQGPCCRLMLDRAKRSWFSKN